jgi:predicted TIM-barrel fold metal-dependent hydrolase
MDFDLLPQTDEIINCHVHTFTFRHVPERYLPWRLVRWLLKTKSLKTLAWILNNLNPLSSNDTFERYLNFLYNGFGKNQEQILNDLMEYYPRSSKFVILSIDMEYIKAGKPGSCFKEQLDELLQIYRKPEFMSRIYPFIFADPRRANILDMIKKYTGDGFKGIKIYPAFGNFPFEECYDPIFSYASEKNIPVLTHCSPYGANIHEKISRLPRVNPRTKKELCWVRDMRRYDNYGDPDNYKYVLERYPNLKLCFGHFGGPEEMERFLNARSREEKNRSWFYKIKELMGQYPNVYTDISYTSVNMSLSPLLNIILKNEKYREKVLYGTDYYLNTVVGNDRRYGIYLRGALGEENFRQIAVLNPLKFLS